MISWGSAIAEHRSATGKPAGALVRIGTTTTDFWRALTAASAARNGEAGNA